MPPKLKLPAHIADQTVYESVKCIYTNINYNE